MCIHFSLTASFAASDCKYCHPFLFSRPTPLFVYACLFLPSVSLTPLHLFLSLSVSICLGGQVGFSEGCTLTRWNGVSLFLQWWRHFAVGITTADIDGERGEDFGGHRELAGEERWRFKAQRTSAVGTVTHDPGVQTDCFHKVRFITPGVLCHSIHQLWLIKLIAGMWHVVTLLQQSEWTRRSLMRSSKLPHLEVISSVSVVRVTTAWSNLEKNDSVIVSVSLTRIEQGHRHCKSSPQLHPLTAAVNERCKRCNCSSVVFYLLIVQSKYKARYHGEYDYCCLSINQRYQWWQGKSNAELNPTSQPFWIVTPSKRQQCIVWAPCRVSDVCCQRFHQTHTSPLTCFFLLNNLSELLPAQRGLMI